MATRRKVKPKKPAPMRLRGNMKLKYAAAVYQMQAAAAKLETLQLDIKNRAEQDPVFAEALKLISSEATHRVDAEKAVSKLHAVALKVCEKFDIPLAEFKHYIVDTESGQITHVPKKEMKKDA